MGAGLAAVPLMSALWVGCGGYLLWKTDHAIEMRKVARQTLVDTAELEITQHELLIDTLLNNVDFTASLIQHREALGRLEQSLSRLASLAPSADQAVVRELSEDARQYETVFSRFTTTHHQARFENMLSLMRWLRDGDDVDQKLEDMKPVIARLVQKAVSESERARRELLWSSGYILIFGLGVGGVVFYRFAKSITRPLIELKESAVRIGEGCSDCAIDVQAPGEIGVLAQAFREMVQKVRRSQAIAIQAEKMAGIGQFAAGVAHDINNPVGVILGFAQILMRNRAETDPMIMPIKSIEREAQRCKTLVQSLLAFSRSQKHDMTLKPEDLRQVVEGALALVETLARTRKVVLVRSLSTEIGPILVDAGQIQQVVINLGVNAIDAMPQGGTLTVGLARKDDHAEISVQDTGTGISPEIRERIFDAFFYNERRGKGDRAGLKPHLQYRQKPSGFD
jgi:signal transduction histidine kinase